MHQSVFTVQGERSQQSSPERNDRTATPPIAICSTICERHFSNTFFCEHFCFTRRPGDLSRITSMTFKMSANKRSRQLLPDLDDLAQRSVSNKMDIAAVKAAYQQFASVELGQCSSHSMKSLDENVKFTWLIAHYGAGIVLPLFIAIQCMPESLTEHQKLKFLRDAIKPVEASETDIEAIRMMLNYARVFECDQ